MANATFTIQERPQLPFNVDLRSVKPGSYRKMAFVQAPSAADEIISIHRESYDLKTTHVPYHGSTLEYEQLGNGKLKVQLFDSHTGEPLSGETIHILGGSRSEATTGGDGEVIINAQSPAIEVTYNGDDWLNPCDSQVPPPDDCVFIGGSQTTILFAKTDTLLQSAIDMIWNFLVISPLWLIYIAWKMSDGQLMEMNTS